MEAKESYELRLEMAEMHEEFIERMSVSYDNKYYIETVWYCYSIFEQRINRTNCEVYRQMYDCS